MKKAFTVIELLVVISIIGLITALIIPVVHDFKKEKALKTENIEQTVLEKGAEPYIINTDPNVLDQQKYNVKKLFKVDGNTFYSFEYRYFGSTKTIIFANGFNNSCMIQL
jgi:prepilin-type N-terminal cleavage/methylation domain-containing protein